MWKLCRFVTVQIVVFALFASTVISPIRIAAADPDSQVSLDERQVFALYFGWWTEETWTTDERLTDVPARPYDVRDPADMLQQIRAAESAGIDAFLVDWLGPDNITDEAFMALLNAAETRDFKIAAVVDLNERDYLSSMESIQDAMEVLFQDRINHPAYLRVDDKPIIFFWAQERFTISQWQYVRNTFDPNHETIWLMEGTNMAYIPTFQGSYLFNVTFSNDPAEMMAYWQNRGALNGGDLFLPTVTPGWDESEFAGWRMEATQSRDRANGDFLQESWEAATSLNTDAVLVVSWNGYFENSHVEPSSVFGTQTTDLLRELIAEWKSG